MMTAGHTANFKSTFIDLQGETAKLENLTTVIKGKCNHCLVTTHTQRVIDAIENVQRRAARFVSIVIIQVLLQCYQILSGILSSDAEMNQKP